MANRLLERTLTADQLPMRGDHYKASGGGGGEKRKILPQNMFMASVRMSPLYTFFASFYNKWRYYLIFYAKELRIRAEGSNNESRTQILPFNCN